MRCASARSRRSRSSRASRCRAHAALFDDDEARKRIAATNARLDAGAEAARDRLAGARAAAQEPGLVDLLREVEQHQGRRRQLRGQIEVLTYELSEAQKRQRDLYVDLDSRMRKIEAAPAAAAPPAPDAAAATAPPTDDRHAPATLRRRRPRRTVPPPCRRRVVPRLGAASSAPTTPRSTSSSAATTRRDRAASRPS